MTLRIHELAKELHVSSKELLEKLKPLSIDAKSHMSVLTDEAISLIRNSFRAPAPKTTKPSTTSKEFSKTREYVDGRFSSETPFVNTGDFKEKSKPLLVGESKQNICLEILGVQEYLLLEFLKIKNMQQE